MHKSETCFDSRVLKRKRRLRYLTSMPRHTSLASLQLSSQVLMGSITWVPTIEIVGKNMVQDSQRPHGPPSMTLKFKGRINQRLAVVEGSSFFIG